MQDLKNIVVNSIGSSVAADNMPNDFELAGNVLDSMAVTNLILAIEEYFSISFDDDDLSIDAFQTIASLASLVNKKLQS